MSSAMPQVPAGNGQHPILMVALAANDFQASTAFYAQVFQWRMHPLTKEVTVGTAPAGPTISLRANTPAGFQGVVPYITVPDVEGALGQAVAAGGSVERAAWSVPMAGKLARFKDPSGTLYGLAAAVAPGPVPPMPMPFGDNPRPPVGSICSLEMYAADGMDAAKYFGGLFSWGAVPTMPQFVAFDPGAGIGGVWQSHSSGAPAVAYIYVANVSESLAAVEAGGGKRLGDPMGMPGMATFGYFSDPSETTMGLIGP